MELVSIEDAATVVVEADKLGDLSDHKVKSKPVVPYLGFAIKTIETTKPVAENDQVLAGFRETEREFLELVLSNPMTESKDLGDGFTNSYGEIMEFTLKSRKFYVKLFFNQKHQLAQYTINTNPPDWEYGKVVLQQIVENKATDQERVKFVSIDPRTGEGKVIEQASEIVAIKQRMQFIVGQLSEEGKSKPETDNVTE